ncbi:MAG: YdeI/OmpD-associated family protein [bacterium]
MGRKDPRVDAYIARAAGFARPILSHIRKVVHAGCPDVEETLKWSAPHFMYKGMLCGMASFKAHCAFGFWKEKLLADKIKAVARAGKPAMGQFGRLTAITDLPGEKTLIRIVREAAALNEQGVKAPARARPKGDRTLKVPDDFMSALRRNRKALTTFDGFSHSNKKDYVEWVTEAKQEETRKKRLETAVAWMAEGKVRNWKYIKC